ncbi:MAG: phosphatase PAP2 family protein [Acidimicrobiales bacterium]
MKFTGGIGMNAERRHSHDQIRSQMLSIVGLGGLMLVVAVLVGRALGVGPVRDWHESTFAPVVEALQRSDALVDVSAVVTDMGHLNLNYLMLAALGVAAWLRHGTDGRAWVIGLAVTALALRPFQAIVSRLVDGSAPFSPLVVGVAGPYFSGGVFRVTLIAALAALVFQRSVRFVVAFAVVAGVVEGVTRLALGRHWPLDVVAAIPVGLAVAFVVAQAVELLAHQLADPDRV